MDKAYMNLKARGIDNIEEELERIGTPTKNVEKSDIARSQQKTDAVIYKQARMYKEISATFQLLHCR